MRRGNKTEAEEKFYLHKKGARRRGIPFKFTFRQWVAWWETNLGPDWLKLRGCRKHQHVMARKGDKGPYAVWNVKCITQSENAREQVSGNLLNTDQAIAIYLSNKTKRALSTEYGVSMEAIVHIRTKKTWGTVTANLTYAGVRGSER